MSASFDFSPLEEVDQFLEVSNHLNANQEEYIRMMFGDDMHIPVIDKVEKLSTTEDRMLNAGEEILKLQAKGFLALSEKVENAEDVFKKTIYAQKMKETVEKPKTDKTIKLPTSSEPFQKFWLSSKIVVNTIHEIRTLPFYDPFDRFEVEQKFIDQVSSVTRIMKHDGLLEERKQTRQQLYKTMKHFVTETMKIRTNLIRNYISAEKVDTVMLTDDQKKEFESFFPVVSSADKENIKRQQQLQLQAQQISSNNKADDVDAKILEHINSTTIKLPNLYKFTDFNTDERSRVRTRKQMRETIQKTGKALVKAMNRPTTTCQTRSEIQARHHSKTTDEIDDLRNSSEADINNINGRPTTSLSLSLPLPSGSQKKRRITTNLISNPSSSAAIRARELRSQSQEVFKGVLPKLSDKEVHSYYWKDNDPLDASRGGQFVNQLDQIKEYTGEVALDGSIFDISEIEMPFKLISEPEGTFEAAKERALNNKPKVYAPVMPSQTLSKIKGVNPFENNYQSLNDNTSSNSNINKNWNLKNLMNNNGGNTNEDEEDNGDEDNDDDEESNGSNGNIDYRMKSMFSTSVKNQNQNKKRRSIGKDMEMNYDIGNNNEDVISYLREQTSEVSREKSGQDLHDRLDQIWESLGFSIVQKLDMVVKYSKDAEESSKLSEALAIWEQALAVAEQYERTYISLKDFLKIEANGSHHVSITASDMREELISATESLKQIASRLWQSFGDELIIKRKSVPLLISDHLSKLKYLCSLLNIDYDNL